MLGTQHHPRRLFSSMPARHPSAPFVSQVVGFQPRGKESEGALEVIRRSVSPYQEAKDDQNTIDPACMRKQEEVPMAHRIRQAFTSGLAVSPASLPSEMSSSTAGWP